MKLYIKINGGVNLNLEYQNGEYDIIKAQLEHIGLQVANSTRIFGNRSGSFYKEVNGEFEQLLKRSLMASMRVLGYNDIAFFDDVNRPLLLVAATGQKSFNLAIFRVVPVENKVTAPVEMFLTIDDMNKITSCVRKVFEIVLNMVSENDVIEIPTALSARLEKIKEREKKPETEKENFQPTLIEVSTVEF